MSLILYIFTGMKDDLKEMKGDIREIRSSVDKINDSFRAAYKAAVDVNDLIAKAPTLEKTINDTHKAIGAIQIDQQKMRIQLDKHTETGSYNTRYCAIEIL